MRESEVKLQRNSTPFYLSLFLSLQQTKRTVDTAPRASRRRRRSRRHRRHRRGGCCRCCARRGRKSACCEEQLCPHWSASSSSSSSSQPLFSFLELPPALSPDVESFAVPDTRGGSERDGRRLCVLGPALPEACSVAKEETLRFVRRGKKLSCSRFTLRDSIEKKEEGKKNARWRSPPLRDFRPSRPSFASLPRRSRAWSLTWTTSTRSSRRKRGESTVCYVGGGSRKSNEKEKEKKNIGGRFLFPFRSPRPRPLQKKKLKTPKQ